MHEEAPYDYVIAGGGTAGWMAAAGLARFTPAGTRIALVESDAIGTVGVGEATIPQIHLWLNALGLDEREFLVKTKASFKLGIEFDGWLREGHSYMHAFGPVGRAQGLLPFQHYWLRARQEGFAKPLSAYSLNEAAARALRMAKGQPGALPYAYHFDAGLFAQHLREFSEKRGVTRIEGTIAEVEQDGETGDIAALVLGGGMRVAGRFFIDCTGFHALLIEDALSSGFDDWSHFLPCDRAMAVACNSGGDFSPYTRSIARKAGWQWRIPLQHRIGNGMVFSSAHISEDEAAATLLANLDGAPQGDPRPIRFTTGKRREHWKNNCLALGLAAGFMEPLESTSIHLVQSAVSRFLSVLPGTGDTQATRDWFNAQADFEWERIRDFLVLHYHANQREGEPFWDHVRTMDVPDLLTAKLDLWRATGFIHREHEELFTEVGWFQVLAGQGVEAESYNPMAKAMSDSELRQMLDKAEAAIAQQVRQMPGHIQFLQNYASGPRPRVEVPA